MLTLMTADDQSSSQVTGSEVTVPFTNQKTSVLLYKHIKGITKLYINLLQPTEITFLQPLDFIHIVLSEINEEVSINGMFHINDI